jgi:hypothetical protein
MVQIEGAGHQNSRHRFFLFAPTNGNEKRAESKPISSEDIQQLLPTQSRKWRRYNG